MKNNMKNNKKFNVLLSSAAIVTMLSTMGIPNVLAADRDIRDLKTGEIVVAENEYKNDLSKRNQVLLNWEDYGFELGNKVYTLSDTNEVWKTDKTMESIPEALKDKVQIDLNEELKVESVSAIDTTKVVTVKATAPNAEEEATADVAIFAYDEEGVRGETAVATDADVEIVEGAIEVEFEGLETGEYVAVVTVGEEEAELDFAVDFDAADAAVDAVNKAKNQVQLAEALGNDYFAEVYDEANIVEYAEEIIEAEDYTTVAEIIEDIEDINEEIETKGEFEAVKKSLEEAHPNQLNIRNILTANFDNVDVANIDAYITAIYGGDAIVDLTTMTAIQNAIDVANATAVVDALFDEGVLAEGVGQAKIDAAKTMVEALKEKEIDVQTLEGQLEEAQDLLDAANALEAATEAINALFVDPKADELELALGVDQDAIDAAQDLVEEVTEGEEKTELQKSLLTAQALLDAYAIKLSGQFTTMGTDAGNLGNVRGYTVGFSLKGDYKMSDLTDVVINVYKDKDLLASVTATDKFFSTEEGGLGSTKAQSAPFDVFGDFDYVEDGYWNYSGWNGEVLDFPTKVEILVTYENGRTAKLTSEDLNEDKTSSTGLAFDEFYVEVINKAATPEDVNAALLAKPVSDYLNTPGADRLFVANEILEARNKAEDKVFANYEALTDALDNALETRTEALEGVNNTLDAGSDISEVIDVLEAVSAEFAEMTNAEKADIAEAFFLGLEFAEEAEDGESTLKTPFRTLAAVKEAAGL